MDSRFKPALACKVKDVEKNLQFPVLASPKLDGIRALVINGQVVSRSLKLIPNKLIQRLYGHHVLDGLDGELIVGSPTANDVFRKTSSAVMSFDGDVEGVTFYIFDSFNNEGFKYVERLADAGHIISNSKKFGIDKHLSLVEQVLCKDPNHLAEIEARYCSMGYEGVMTRNFDFVYRQGRCTPKEQAIVKHKRFEDSEAVITGVIELFHNGNDKDSSGKRTSHKAGKKAMDTMGALSVKDIKTGVEFEIGTGFTEKDRAVFWASRESAVANLVVKYKYFPIGVKDKPRHPVYIGLRSAIDMS